MTGEHDRRVVVTGGPGSGRSTLLDRLEAAGVGRSEEAGRSTIRDQLAIGGKAVPWGPEPVRRVDAGLGVAFLPVRRRRSGAGLLRPRSPRRRRLPAAGGSPRARARPRGRAGFRCRRRVLVAPPWPEIYENDHERKQSLAEAERTCESMVATCPEYGYELVTPPRSTPEERVCFVRDILGRK